MHFSSNQEMLQFVTGSRQVEDLSETERQKREAEQAKDVSDEDVKAERPRRGRKARDGEVL